MVYFSAEYILQKINICGEIMFRDITRKKQKITENECIDILISEKRGVLSVIGDGGYPYGMPMNYRMKLILKMKSEAILTIRICSV